MNYISRIYTITEAYFYQGKI